MFEIDDAATNHVGPLTDVDASVIVGGFDPVDVDKFDEKDFSGALDDEALELGRSFATESDLLFGALECEVKARVVKGLEEIVEGTGLEGAESVLIVGSGEDDCGRQVFAEALDYFEAVTLGHLDVEEEEIGFRIANDGGCIESGIALSDDFDTGLAAKKDCEIATRQRFVIDDDRG